MAPQSHVQSDNTPSPTAFDLSALSAWLNDAIQAAASGSGRWRTAPIGPVCFFEEE